MTALWLADCADDGDWVAHSAALLSASEQQRHAAIQNSLRRRQFLMGRWLLRHMLTRRYDLPLSHWQITEQPQQAPRLQNPAPEPIKFSIAHSRDRVACLLTRDAVAGCDIEYMGRARNVMQIAALYFDASDVQRLSGLQGARQTQDFYRLWTQHEARFKAAASQAGCNTAFWQDYCLGVALGAPSAVDVQWAEFTGAVLTLTPIDLQWTK